MLGLFMKYTPDGPIPIQKTDSGEKELPVPTTKLGELPSRFGDRHHKVITQIVELVKLIKLRGRQVPLLRSELHNYGADRKAIRDLEQWGFIKEQLIPLEREKTKTKIGARAVIFFAPLGHAYVKEKL